MGHLGSFSVGAIAATLAIAGCGGTRGAAVEPARAQADDGRVRSNVLRSDYVGSRACEPCHGEIYRAWAGSPMHRMTRDPLTAEVRAPFDGRTFRFKEDTVTLSRQGGERFVAIQSRAFGDHTYRVTRVIGGRYREDFAGVEASSPSLASKDELILPVTYVYSPPSFRLKGYSVMVPERPGLKAGGVWNQTCVFCHNTVPYFSTVMGELLGPGAPGYQGEVVDRLLPSERRAHLSIVSTGDAVRAAAAETTFLGSSERVFDDASGALATAIRATKEGFDGSHVVELGIGCESCHGGSREHVVQVRQKPSFEIRSSFIGAAPSAWEDEHHAARSTTAVNRTCARCHQVLFSRYPFTWEGGRRNGDAGGSHISSGEARDYLLGGCTTAMSCTACHDPHALDDPEKLHQLETPAGNRVCVRCHEKLGSDDALRAHAHHDPTGAGAACINCHMPKKNMGLGYNLTRYHRIGSPTDRAKVENDRPLECALCHTNKTVAELVDAMERFWPKRYDRARLAALYGDLAARPLLASVWGGKAHEQATAMHVLGEARDRGALDAVTAQLVNRYPLVRYFARQAAEKIADRPCDVDLDQDDAKIEADTKRWLAEVRGRVR